MMVSNQSTDAVIEQQVAEYNDNLELQLNQIGKIFDIPHIINEPQGKQQIFDYYVKGKFGLKLTNAQGFYHYGVSYDGKHKKEDLEEQARIVERYICERDAKNVLELASGMGGNMAYLARRNPSIMFDGVDLTQTPFKRFTRIPNVDFQFGDYHDLSAFMDSAYDVVFIIEALCYSTNKLQVFHEVKKKLKKDGLFIVIDAYRRDRAIPLSPSEETMWKLMEMGWAIDKVECIKDVEDYMREVYSMVEADDLSHCFTPSANSIAHRFRYYFVHPMYARVVNKLLSFDVVKGFIAAYICPTLLAREILCYYIHVLKNDK